jgi:hypothetical protein
LPCDEIFALRARPRFPLAPAFGRLFAKATQLGKVSLRSSERRSNKGKIEKMSLEIKMKASSSCGPPEPDGLRPHECDDKSMREIQFSPRDSRVR